MFDGVRPTESGKGEGGEQPGGTVVAAAFDPREFVEAVSGADASKYYSSPVIVCFVVGRKADDTNEGPPLRSTLTVWGKYYLEFVWNIFCSAKKLN